MKKLAFLFGFIIAATFADAQTITAVEVGNVAQLQASSFGAYVHLQGLVTPGDGSDAYYFQNGFVCTPDGFAILKDKSGHCYFRGAGAISTPTINVATIAALRALPTANAPAFPYVVVRDYYGTGTGCPIHYAWNAASAVADDGGYSIKLTDTGGAGRYLLDEPPTSPWHSCWYGVKVDSPAAIGTGTDNSVQMQALLNGAYTYGPNHVHLDSSLGNCIKVASVLNPNQGETIEGDGDGDSNQTASTGSCVSYTGIPGAGGAYVFTTQSILTGSGTVPFAGPKFRNFTIYYFSTDTNPGGCIQLNSIAGGFTDLPGSQQPIIRPEIRNMYCSLRQLNNSAKIGIQISKAREAIIDNVNVFGGLTGFDLEGVENARLAGCATSANFGVAVRLQAQNSFGNNDTVANCQFLSLGSFGQTVDSMLFDGARASTIEYNLFENFAAITINSQIHIAAGAISAGLYNNIMGGNGAGTVANPYWLQVDTILDHLTAYGNGGTGVGIPPAKFLTGNYYQYLGGPRQILSVIGNLPSGDSGWPFNSVSGLDTILPPGTEAVWTANTSGLGPNGYGVTEIPVNSIFTLPVTGAGNYLEGIINRLPPAIGTFNLNIQAAQTTGAGQLTCQLEDNGALIGAPIAQAITASMNNYTLAFAGATTINAGWRCWNTGTGTVGNPALIARISLVH